MDLLEKGSIGLVLERSIGGRLVMTVPPSEQATDIVLTCLESRPHYSRFGLKAPHEVRLLRGEVLADDAPLSDATAVSEMLNIIGHRVHAANRTWWRDPATGAPLNRNVGEMLCLVHSEISEAMEGHRKNLPDDKLPDRPMIEVELADAVIRIFDIAAGLGLDLGGAFVAKLAYNRERADHKPEARLAAGGKRY